MGKDIEIFSCVIVKLPKDVLTKGNLQVDQIAIDIHQICVLH